MCYERHPRGVHCRDDGMHNGHIGNGADKAQLELMKVISSE